MKKLLRFLMLAVLFLPFALQAQLNATYQFSTGTDATKWYTLTADSTVLKVGTGNDSYATPVTNIGFAFTFAGVEHTQFSANSDGTVRLGSTVIGTSAYTTPFSTSNANTNAPKICGLGCDGYLPTTGYIAYQLFGEEGSRVLVIEIVTTTYSQRTSAPLFAFQVQLAEADNSMTLVYSPTAPETNPSVTYQLGACAGANDIVLFNVADNTMTAYTAGTSTNNASGTWPDAGRYYTIAPNPDACYPVTALAASNITTDGVTLTWSDENNTGVTYDIYNTADNSPVASSLTATTYDITGLDANTSYSFAVITNCGGDNISNPTTIQIRTACDPIATGTFYDFEDMSTGAAPQCFTHLGNGTSNVTSGSSDAYYHSATKYIQFSGATSDNILILPETEDAINTLQLKFWTRPENPTNSNCGSFSVGYVTDITDVTTFVDLENYNYSDFTGYEQKAVMYSDAPEGARMAMRHNSGASNWYWRVDDVTIEELPSCVPVSALSIQATTANSLTLSWISDANSFIILDMADSTEIGTSNTNSYEVTDLAANTAYTFGVVVDCGNEYSDTILVSGRTACAAIAELPYTMGFEDADLQGTTNALLFPYCWTRINTLASGTYTYYPYSYTSSYSTVSHGGSRALYFYASSYGTYADTTGFVMPELDVNTYPMNANRVTFWAKVTSTTAYSVQVGTMSDPNDLETFTPIETVTVTGTDYTKYTVSLAEADDDDPYVAFIVPKVSATMYIDDVTLEEAPSCLEVPSVAITETTSSTITLSWTENPGNASATYTVYEVTPDGNVEIESNIADATYTVEDLEPNTQYTFGVQANCGASGDAPLTTVSGRTLCTAFDMPFTEDFNTLTAGIPSCWNNDEGTTTTASYKWNYYATSYEGVGLRFNSYSNSNGNTNILATPSINIDNAARLRFMYKNATGGDFSVFASIDGGITFDTLATALTDVSAWTQFELNLDDSYTGETAIFYFKGTSNYGNGDAYIYLDNVIVDEQPSCLAVTGLTMSDITSEGATLTWNGDATSYNVYAIATDTTLEQNVTTNTITLTGLDANTQFTYGVRAVCGSNESEMVTASFRTACVALSLPYTETFETTSNALSCWTTEGNGNWTIGTGDYSTSTGAFEGSRNARITHSTDGNVTKLISPVLDGVEEGLTLNFAYVLRSWAGDVDELRVYSRADAESAWQQVAEYTNAAATWTVENVIIPGTVYQIAFEHTDNYGYGLGIDSVAFTAMTSDFCFAPTGLTVSDITTEGATLTWNGDANSYNVYVITTDTTLVENVTGNTITLDNLTAMTSYTYGVTSVCTNGESEMVSVTFTTACTAVELPYTETFEATSGTRDCWNLVSNNTANVGGTYGMGFVTVDNREVLRFSSYNSASDYNQYGFSPLMEVSSDAANLMVNVVYATYGSTDELYFGYITDTDTIWDPTPYSTDNNSSASNWQTYTAVIPATATQLAIHYYGNYKYYAWIDSVSVTEMTGDYCYAVTNLTVDSTTTSSVFLSWTDNNNTGITYTIYNGTTEVATNVATTNYEVTGLGASSNYTFGVVANCSATDASDMVTINATTECGDVTALPYTEGFENGLGCWTTINGSSDGQPWNAQGTFSDGTITPHTGNGMAASWSWNSGAMHANAWLISPKFVLPNTTENLTFTWWERTNSGYPDHYSVVLSTTTNDTAAFTTVVYPNNTAAGEWTQKNIDLSAYAGQNIYIAFHHVDYDMNYLLIDDIELSQGGYVPPTPDTLTVTFAVNDATMGTTVPAPGTYQYVSGDTIFFKAVRNTGYHYVGWELMLGSTVADTFGLQYLSAYMPADALMQYGNITLTALFEVGNPDSTTVTYAVNDPTMGTITPAPGTYTIYVGDAIDATATPNTGYQLSAWMFDIYLGTTLYSSDTIFSTGANFSNPMQFGTLPQNFADYNATITITALFEAAAPADSLTVHLTINNPDLGSINPAPGTYHLALNESMPITATPNEGVTFNGFRIYANGEIIGNSPAGLNPFPFTVTSMAMSLGEVTIEALFADSTSTPDSLTLILNTADATMGTTNPAPGTYHFAVGDTSFINAVPNPGYHFLYWIETVSAVGQSFSDTLIADTVYAIIGQDMASMTLSLTAYFEADSTPVVVCNTPTGLHYTAIENHAIAIAWDADANVNSWNIRYRMSGNGAWNTATSNTNSYTISGLQGLTSYDIEVQANCGDGNVSEWCDAITVQTTNVGIVNHLENSVVLFPNPAREYVDIRIDGEFNVSSMEVYDVYGKLINNINVVDNPTRIYVSNLSNGMYFVRVTTDAGVVTKTFVKK